MDLRTLSHRLDALAGRLPPAPTRPMAIITVSRFNPDNPPEPLPVEVAFRTDKYGVRHPSPWTTASTLRPTGTAATKPAWPLSQNGLSTSTATTLFARRAAKSPRASCRRQRNCSAEPNQHERT